MMAIGNIQTERTLATASASALAAFFCFGVGTVGNTVICARCVWTLRHVMRFAIPEKNKSRKAFRVLRDLFGFFNGAVGGTRTRTVFRPLAPQASVSTNSTTTARDKLYTLPRGLASGPAYFFIFYIPGLLRKGRGCFYRLCRTRPRRRPLPPLCAYLWAIPFLPLCRKA